MTTSPDLEALKALAELARNGGPWKCGEPLLVHDVNILQDLQAALPALERLLAGQQEAKAWLIDAPDAYFATVDSTTAERHRKERNVVTPLFAAPPVQEAGREPTQLWACEITRLGLHMRQLYEFAADPECEACQAYISGKAEPASLGAARKKED